MKAVEKEGAYVVVVVLETAAIEDSLVDGLRTVADGAAGVDNSHF